MRIIVLAKQVPDTKNVAAEVMKPDGTINRSALAAIFNPEDLNALEMGLELRERFGGEVVVMTMGPPQAAEILRDSLSRGADRVILLSDPRFAASDTLATSYTIATTIQRHLSPYDVVVCGRQAIDGDTAQVGPQVAEKLGIGQVTYADKVLAFEDGWLRVHRDLGRAEETVETRLPVLLTVTKSANKPRWPNSRLILKYRRARSRFEVESEAQRRDVAPHVLIQSLTAAGLYIDTWGAEDVGAEPDRIGISGSPTKVKKVENVVLAGRDLRMFASDDQGVRDLVHTLIEERTFG